jgi:uncharacterized protein with GYD domain
MLSPHCAPQAALHSQEQVMPKYLFSISYTAEGAKGVRKDGGTKRRKVASKALESLGGKLESLYFCFGQYDAVVIADLPDAASAAALSLAVAGTGGAETTTTVLITPEEMDKAAGKKTAYKAPGS